jgi:hypothetical protein
MEFFTYFPRIDYSENKMVNIMVRSRIRELILNNTLIYYPYVVRDGERPDILAHTYYGHPKYTWIIFYVNEMFDPIFDWVLDEDAFMQYMNHKYAIEDDLRPGFQIAHQTVHEYLNGKNFVVDSKTWFADVIITLNALPNSYTVGQKINLGDLMVIEVLIVDVFDKIVSLRVSYESPIGLLRLPWDYSMSHLTTKWDYENNLNEDRRHIKLLDNVFVLQVMNEMKNIFKTIPAKR